jgi:hypothetical protein
VEDRPASLTAAAAARALDDLCLWQLKVHDRRERKAFCFEEVLQRLSLHDRAGKSVEDKATTMEQTRATLAHHVPHGGVGHEFAMTHEIQRFLHRGGLIAIKAFTGRAKDVAGRKMASTQTIRQILGLRAFSYAGCAEEN